MTPIRSGEGISGRESPPGQSAVVDSAGLLARFESVPFSRWHSKARIIMGSATFFDAFNALSLAFVLPVLIRSWHITPRQSGFLISASYVGQLIGAFLFSWLAEKFGRVRGATAAVAVMSVMSLACAVAGNFRVLFAFRLIQGIGVGGEMPIAAAYISELSNARRRGRFFMLYEMIFPLGLMATGQIGAFLVPAWGWKTMFLIGAIPGLVITVLVARLPESIRWLIAKGRIVEAERIVRQIEASTDRRLDAGLAPDRASSPARPLSSAAAAASLQPQQSRWREPLSRFYRGRTLVVWMLWATAFFIANSLNNWMPSLYNTVYHLGLKQSLRAASMTNVAQVLILLLCAFSIDRIGRRNWTVASFVVGGALLASLGVIGARSVLSMLIFGTLSYGVIGSINAVLFLYTPEIYPTRMRVIGIGLATSWLRLASAVGPALVGFMVGAKGINSVFWMFVGVSGIGVLAAMNMIETRGRRLEEVAP